MGQQCNLTSSPPIYPPAPPLRERGGFRPPHLVPRVDLRNFKQYDNTKDDRAKEESDENTTTNRTTNKTINTEVMEIKHNT
jgi:hypothetical protein